MGLPSVCIVTIFRNEANAICEWATHHIQQGVSRLFMIDHNSTDRWQEEVSPALRQHMTVVYEPRSSASEDKPVQVPLLNQHFLRAARAYTWVMGVDLDEFVYARGSHAGSIPSALAAVPWWRPGVRLTSKRFGSAGLREQPRSMVEGFLRRYNLSAQSEHCGTRMKACAKQQPENAHAKTHNAGPRSHARAVEKKQVNGQTDRDRLVRHATPIPENARKTRNGGMHSTRKG